MVNETVNETPSVPDTSEDDAAAERRRREQEEEEEEARRRAEREAEDEERQRQAEEERRQREDKRRAEEEARRRAEEEEQERQEEEERERREEEAEARKQREEERARKMAEEESRKKRGKRKGLGGLTPEKKKKLKQIIMQKAAEDLKKEALAKAKEKEKFINERVGLLSTDGLGEDQLRKLIKDLHEKLAQIHSEAYDVEFKLHKQDKEIVDLNMKISDSKGKFAKPVLRKVNKTEQNISMF